MRLFEAEIKMYFNIILLLGYVKEIFPKANFFCYKMKLGFICYFPMVKFSCYKIIFDI